MPISDVIDELAAFAPTDLPVISLYLNTQPDQHGRANFDSFVRKSFNERAQSFPLRSDARVSFDKDTERIEQYLKDELKPSSNGVAIFACHAQDEFFRAVQLDAPVDEHKLYVYHQPHLYPLVRLDDQYPRYAALIVDTNAARLFVFGLGRQLNSDQVKNTNVNKTQLGGWSQARYQRHIENYYLHHAKEVVDALDRTVREENINQIVLAGDEVIIPILREQLPKHLNDKIVDVLRLDITTPEHEVMRQTLEAMREHDAKDDQEKIERLLNEYRADGLAVVGAHDSLVALRNGQVDELLLSANLEENHEGFEEISKHLLAGNDTQEIAASGADNVVVKIKDELVTRAKQTGAQVTFIEDQELLAEVGGIGATLRYRVQPKAASASSEI